MRLPRPLHYVITLSLFLSPSFAFAFNPSYLISDAEFTDRFSMDLGSIQRVLERGTLARYVTEDIDGRRRSAAEIIWRAAQRNGISSKVILATLQKEQSLIEDPTPKQSQFDWAMGYGICDSCTYETPAAQRFRGFSKQINSATLQLSDGYLADLDTKGVTVAGYAPGRPMVIDGQLLVPENRATVALYTYTPHLHGNQLFATAYERYFASIYPTGTLLQNQETGGVFLISQGKKRAIGSRAILTSRFNERLIIQVEPSVLSSYEDGLPISFINYSILTTPSASYLLVDDTLRPFDSRETMRALGFNPDEELPVTQAELAGYPIGEPVTLNSKYPEGIVMQHEGTGTAFFVQNGTASPIASSEILKNRFSDRQSHRVPQARLEEFRPGNGVKLLDGTLVQASGSATVYVISEGARRPIADEATFTQMGWRFGDVLTVLPETLAVHPEGSVIRLEE